MNKRRFPVQLLMYFLMLMFLMVIVNCSSSSSPPIPTYTVTYSGNGSTSGTVPVDSNTYQQGHNVTVLGNTGNLVYATGYSFNGWNTKADGSGTPYTQGMAFAMGTANVTFYAMWTTNPTYTVTYNGNGSTGGTVPVDTDNYQQGQSVMVFGNTGNLVQTDYSFAGWNTQANGSGTTYTQGQTFPMGTANVNLYAMWTANPTYKVTYSGNSNTGGTAPVDTNNYEQGHIVTVLGNTGNLVNTGYSFTGWNTQANGSGTTYTQGQTFPIGSANVTLYAMWTANPTYTVTYSGNGNTGGIVPVDSSHYQQGQTVTVLGNTGILLKTGYSFAGWNTQANGSGTTYTQGQTFPMGSANVTLYAMWTANPTYTETYSGNGNTGGTAPADTNNYQQGQTVTVLGNTGNLVNTGYSFNGWNTQANGSGTTYTQGQTFPMGSANVTLYAMWTANPTYTVTYSGNGNTGGSVPVDSTHYQQGQTVTVMGNTGNLIQTGYSFAGWNTQANGSGTTYTQGQTFPMSTANVTLYAMWTANPTYTVTYSGNGNTGGSVPVDSTHYQQGQTVTVLGNTGNLVETGYSFNGWNTQANGSGTTYSQGQTFPMSTANVTLYASWTASTMFTQADLTGTWVIHGLKAGNGSLWKYMTLTFDYAGNSTASNCLDSTGSTTCPSGGTATFTVGSNGVITASGSNIPPSFNGTMTSNKNFIAGTSNDSGTPTGAADLWIMQKVVPGTIYSSADIKNKSFVVHQLMTSTTGDNEWVYGAGTTDASGNVTLTSEADSGGGVNNGTGTTGTLSVDGNGVVTLTGSGNGNDATFNGFLSADKKTIVGTETELNGVTFDLIITQVTGQTYTPGPLPAGTWTKHMIHEVNFFNSPDYDSPATPYAFWVNETQTVGSNGAYTYSNVTSDKSGYTAGSGGTASISSSGTTTSTENLTYNGQMSDDGTFSVGTSTKVDAHNNNWYILIVHTK